MGQYDTAGKQLITLYHQAWAEWVLQEEQIRVQEELSEELKFLTRRTDSLLKVVGLSGEFLSLTELQFKYDPEMALRIAIYKLLAQQKYGLPVYATVIFFLPPPEGETIPTAYHQIFMGQTSHEDYRIIKLWELEAEAVLEYNNPMLLPFVPLMKGGGTEQIVRRCAERIRQEPEPAAAELEAILAIFASYILDVAIIRELLRWNMDVIEESPLIQEMQKIWLEKGLEKGRFEGRVEGLEEGLEKGVEKGRQEAMRKTLKLVLAIRFEVTLEEFDDRLAKLSWQALEKLNEIALKVDTLTEFSDQLAEMLPPDSSTDSAAES